MERTDIVAIYRSNLRCDEEWGEREERRLAPIIQTMVPGDSVQTALYRRGLVVASSGKFKRPMLARGVTMPLLELLEVFEVLSGIMAVGSYVDVLSTDGRCFRLQTTHSGVSVEDVKPTLRFVPTIFPGAYMHLGHLWTAVVNRELADAVGGRLCLDFERSNAFPMSGEKEALKLEIAADLEWGGVVFDDKKDMEDDPRVKETVGLNSEYIAAQRPPYSRALFERVVRDEMEGFDMILRGEETLCGDLLYDYFAGLLDMPIREKFYIPSVRSEEGFKLSKSIPTTEPYSLKAMREMDVDPARIVQYLKKVCLREPSLGIIKDGFVNFENFERDPRIVLSDLM